MRTRIRGTWVIAYEAGAHQAVSDGEVVYEGDRIVFAGRGYAGPADRTIDARGCLVGPGLINLHAVANVDLQLFRIDADSPGYPKPRRWIEDRGGPEVLDEAMTEASARFSVACILRGGATTFGAITTMAPKRWEDPPYEPEQIARAAGELGGRAYVAHQIRSTVPYWDGRERGEVEDERRATAALERARAFAARIEGTYDGRLRGYIFPYTLDACTPALLRAAKAAADDLRTHLRMHFSQSVNEIRTIRARYGKTPVRHLEALGILDRNLILTHALDIADDELRLLAEHGVTVCHCPVVFVRRARTLRSFDRYRRAGVNLALGTDTFPQDIVREMRYAALLGKVDERSALGGTAAAVFHAATLGGARALGRDDLGRLAPEAKADIVVVDLERLHIGPVVDPVKALVYRASSADIIRVIVDGRTVVEDGRLLTADEEELLRRAQVPYDAYKAAFARWDPAHRPPAALFPPALPLH